MQLNQEQIQQIKDYLEAINFNYIDLKLEILDHMITDIENIMQEKQVDFHTAFTNEKLKWNSSFRKTFTYYLGIYFTAPKIVIDKAKKIFRPFYFGYLLAYFLPLIWFKTNEITINPIFNNVLIYVDILSAIIFSYFQIKLFKQNEETLYSFILKTQRMAIVLFLFVLLLILVSATDMAIFTSFSIVEIYTAIVTYFFYKEHIKEVKKVKHT